MVLVVAVAGLQWPALPVAGQAGPDLPAVQQVVPPSESSAPNEDTDLWRLDDVRVLEWDCYSGNTTREEYGVFGLQSLSVASECEGYWGKAKVQGTMGMSYPDLMQGGSQQPSPWKPTAPCNGR
jgi:hypothetical protein